MAKDWIRGELEVRTYPEKGGTFKFMVLQTIGDAPPLQVGNGFPSAAAARRAGELAAEQLRAGGV
jgi:hypothetical protein